MAATKRPPTRRTAKLASEQSGEGQKRVSAALSRDAADGTVRAETRVAAAGDDPAADQVTATQETAADGTILSQSVNADAESTADHSGSETDQTDSMEEAAGPGEAVLKEVRTSRSTLRKATAPVRERTRLQTVLRQAAHDTALRARLLTEPHTVLSEAGITVPASVALEVHENAPTRLHLTIPADAAALAAAEPGASAIDSAAGDTAADDDDAGTKTGRNILDIFQGELTDEMVDVGSMTNTGNNNTNTVYVYKQKIIINF